MGITTIHVELVLRQRRESGQNLEDPAIPPDTHDYLDCALHGTALALQIISQEIIEILLLRMPKTYLSGH